MLFCMRPVALALQCNDVNQSILRLHIANEYGNVVMRLKSGLYLSDSVFGQLWPLSYVAFNTDVHLQVLERFQR